ncbi:MAG: hypothetical protein IPM96_14095 [Ignavibacteria bacterium]|nr:hypothetical protein [Ignavibacteria bacterium]
MYSARNVAQNLGFSHYTLDFPQKFNDIVINNFISEYLKGNTPNPCVLCNKSIKWGALLKKLNRSEPTIWHRSLCKIKFDKTNNRYNVSEAADKKRISHTLYGVSRSMR